jgi:transcription antitermination factor NusG
VAFVKDHPWFAVKVRTCREKFVALSLRQKGLTEFLPLYRARRRWSDRFQEIELALFPGYLFCRLDPLHRLPVLTTPGVHSILGVGKTPIPVDESEVAAIQAIVSSGLRVGPWPFLEAGQRVRIEEGPLRGVEGILIEVKKQNRLVASVTLLQRSVAVEIERDWVRPLSPVRRMGAVTATSTFVRDGFAGRPNLST